MARVSDSEIVFPFEELMDTLKEMDKGGVNTARTQDSVNDVVAELGKAIRVAHIRIQILHREWKIQRCNDECDELIEAVKMFEDDLKRALES